MASIFPKALSSASKINVTSGHLPAYVTASQAPTKKSPWRTIRGVEYNRHTTVILPDELYHLIWDKVDANIARVQYAKVIMKLEDALKGDFFTEYIKRGNVLMLSEGEAGVDNIFSLKEGVLRLELSKDSYERAGLQGTPVPSGGSKHAKLRYLVEINLRLPSMLHGKKGFDRLVWAAQHVLNQSLNWLFLDLNPNTGDISTQNTQPLSNYRPTIHLLTPSIQTLQNPVIPPTLVTIPGGVPFTSLEAHESLCDILEYIDMLSLASPRVQATDQTHSFISRYEVPDVSDEVNLNVPSRPGQPVKILTWTGLIPSRWILELVCAIIRYSRTENFEVLSKQHQWLAISVSAHKTQAVNRVDGYTTLLQPARNLEQPRIFHPNHPSDTPSIDLDVDMERRGQDTSHQGGDDVDMTQAPIPDKIQQKPESAPSGAGLQRYLCAEYIDSLT